MKYYIYISPTKVEMLYSQIPDGILAGITSELKVNLGIVAATLKTGQLPSNDSLFAKVNILAKYIRDHESVGTWSAPKSYFAGTLPLRQGTLGRQLACFGNYFDGTVLALIGSCSSIIGEGSIDAKLKGTSIGKYEEDFLCYLVENQSDEYKKKIPYFGWGGRAMRATRKAIRQLPLEFKSMEFIARTVYTEKRIFSRFVVGTPIYVALGDETTI